MNAVVMPAEPQEREAFLITGQGTRAVAPGLWVLHGQGQSFVAEVDGGLVLVDAGPGGRTTRAMITALREVSQAPLLALCHSHGHLGYNAGVPLWLAHARERGDPPPRVIAHANVPRRLARYRETMPLQERMAEIQFRAAPMTRSGRLPVHDPLETFEGELVLGSSAGRHVTLLWSPSETDDAIALWCPAQGVLYGGPTTIDSIPNLGTPLRSQRDARRWAQSLERLAALGARHLVREFGDDVVGADAVRTVLTGTAQALHWLRDETVRLMNAGWNEREILERIEPPPALFDQPWMRPTYGDPLWIVRDIWRSENGWWDRNPTHLHPAPLAAQQQATADAITDKDAVLRQARALAGRGEFQLALHVIDLLATLHAVEDPAVAEARALKAQWLRQRASGVRSYVSKSLYHASADALEHPGRPHFGLA
ncbi:MAG: alkyl sulfatase dimerization domain-containing protein [Rhodoferax sp.]